MSRGRGDKEEERKVGVRNELVGEWRCLDMQKSNAGGREGEGAGDGE